MIVNICNKRGTHEIILKDITIISILVPSFVKYWDKLTYRIKAMIPNMISDCRNFLMAKLSYSRYNRIKFTSQSNIKPILFREISSARLMKQAKLKFDKKYSKMKKIIGILESKLIEIYSICMTLNQKLLEIDWNDTCMLIRGTPSDPPRPPLWDIIDSYSNLINHFVTKHHEIRHYFTAIRSHNLNIMNIFSNVINAQVNPDFIYGIINLCKVIYQNNDDNLLF